MREKRSLGKALRLTFLCQWQSEAAVPSAWDQGGAVQTMLLVGVEAQKGVEALMATQCVLD